MWYFQTDEYKEQKRQIDQYEKLVANCNYELQGELTKERRAFVSATRATAIQRIKQITIDLRIAEINYEKDRPKFGKEDARSASIAKSQRRDRW